MQVCSRAKLGAQNKKTNQKKDEEKKARAKTLLSSLVNND